MRDTKKNHRFVKSLSIYRAGYSLVKLVIDKTKEFSRALRPTLGQQMLEHSVQLVVNVYRANSAENKYEHIGKILEGAEALEMLFQLAFDLGQINDEAYAESIEITQSIGRQAGGWRKKYTPAQG